MKIVYTVASISNSGGIERVLCTKANYFAEVLGYEVFIVVCQNRKQAFFPFSDKIQIHSLDIELRHKPWMIFGSQSKKLYREKLFAKLEEIKPDVTISMFGLDAEFLYQAKDGSQKVLEFHFTKNYLRHLGQSLVNDRLRFVRKLWLELLLKKEAYYASQYDHIVLLTERDKRLWGGGEKFQVIPNPLSFECDRQAALQNKRIVSMGRLVVPKGFHYLIQAFALVTSDVPDGELHIYGEGQDRAFLQALINRLSLQEKCKLLPPTKDVKQTILDASVFVLPSLYDGFGLVLTEAMECGLPCIAFDCECGPSEIITDGEDGYLVKTKDINQLADRMRVLMRDEDLRMRMGAKAKENVKRFEVSRIMNTWKAYLSEVIK